MMLIIDPMKINNNLPLNFVVKIIATQKIKNKILRGFLVHMFENMCENICG